MRNDGVSVTSTSETGPEAVEIRRLTYSDLPQVMAIERRSFPSPWSLAMFLSELSRPQSVCLAAATDTQLAGYLVSVRLDREWHLANIAVAPEWRRQGIGSRLVRAMFEVVGNDKPFTLEVRPSNTSAIALYEGLGFRSAGRRPRYYPDNNEDAVIMWRNRELDPEPALGG
jgi:ribosomal-protein-alanine N-acetyltransferase